MEKNPLRTLDCKVETCKTVLKDAPLMLNHLSEEDKAHFDQVLAYLDEMNIPYEIDPWIVRGLDYYTRTVFEFISEDIGAQGTVCGGGRYDNLIEQMGGAPTPGVGFGAGIERLLLTLQHAHGDFVSNDKIDLFIGYMGDEAKKKAVKLTHTLRKKHIRTCTDLLGKSVKAQMKYADKINAHYSLIIGDQEPEKNEVTVKNMKTGENVSVSMELIDTAIKL